MFVNLRVFVQYTICVCVSTHAQAHIGHRIVLPNRPQKKINEFYERNCNNVYKCYCQISVKLRTFNFFVHGFLFSSLLFWTKPSMKSCSNSNSSWLLSCHVFSLFFKATIKIWFWRDNKIKSNYQIFVSIWRNDMIRWQKKRTNG